MLQSADSSSSLDDENTIYTATTSDEKLAKPTEEAQGHAQAQASAQPIYSIYTRQQKIFIVFMSGLGGFFSPLSANTYLPSVPGLSVDLGVSVSLMNLTVTAFLIFQGLAPSFYGDLADRAGRRPAYLISFIIYVAANIGLATQSSYAALFMLRCLQVRCSATLSHLPTVVHGQDLMRRLYLLVTFPRDFILVLRVQCTC